jgi:hypothetical protein
MFDRFLYCRVPSIGNRIPVVFATEQIESAVGGDTIIVNYDIESANCPDIFCLQLPVKLCLS